ncbi:MAG: amidophosphoribosyltransferase [Candidatus Omnitrophica bacterium CG_4_9_14_0_2_um_filter_42_8]|nr:MAG: amidophosphoribosyltransferase [Candidatus Omnitrophica bacterium CG22_combo_CG10-13_8_21_14_all_43_16]PJC47042.1 MAG: amidophosphoribosyltransferase [Candidatus Omnitrophica bacterium CG_4_9_14_0_2_um_filter_42_8]
MSGVFGVVSEKNCVNDLFYGVDYQSHLGTQYGGIAILSGKRIYRQIHDISQSQFKSKFFEDYKKLEGGYGIGVISDSDAQPMFLNTKFGSFALCMTGLIENTRELIAELHKKECSFSETEDGAPNVVEVIAKLISMGDDIVSGVEHMFTKIIGSCSVLILCKDGIYAARDRFGYTPLVIGKREEDFAIASESSAFQNTGFQIYKYLLPGEIVLVNENGLKEVRPGHKSANQICSFLWIYTGFPASSYEGINVEVVRERCGAYLAKHDKDIDVDVVSGVPDSGIAHAIGYAMESGKPYRRPLVKYTAGYGRSYTPPLQEIRDHIAKMKLIPIKDVIEGKRIVVCEDSIVRGTQLKNFTVQKLWDNGAKEIHVRPACPPLMYPCKFCLSTRTIHELAARKAIKDIEGRDIDDMSEYVDHATKKYQKMVEWIRKDIGVTTLRYQTLSDMIKAIGLPAEKLCTYCWNGECLAKGNLL